MCYITDVQALDIIREAVADRLKIGVPFTGLTVTRATKAKLLLLDSRETTTHSNISSFVRELFNTGEMPGWASTHVDPKKGPVVYFKLSRGMTVTNYIYSLRDLINGQQVEGEAREN